MTTMKTRDLIHALLVLADRHDSDEKSPFDTDWSAVCREVANHLECLQHDLDDALADVAAWAQWYEDYDVELIKKTEAAKEEEKPAEIQMIYSTKNDSISTPQEEKEEIEDADE